MYIEYTDNNAIMLHLQYNGTRFLLCLQIIKKNKKKNSLEMINKAQMF
jgi:hypothetical protein